MPIDIPGTAVFTAGIALLVYGLNDSSRIGWKAPSVLVGVILGVCLLFVFIFVETRMSNPAVPRDVWKSAPFFLMLVAVLAFGGSFSSWFFITTQLCVNLLRYTPVLTAVYFLVRVSTPQLNPQVGYIEADLSLPNSQVHSLPLLAVVSRSL